MKWGVGICKTQKGECISAVVLKRTATTHLVSHFVPQNALQLPSCTPGCDALSHFWGTTWPMKCVAPWHDSQAASHSGCNMTLNALQLPSCSSPDTHNLRTVVLVGLGARQEEAVEYIRTGYD